MGFIRSITSPVSSTARFMSKHFGSGLSDMSKVFERNRMDYKSLKMMGNASMKMLGTTAALTYGYRTLRRATGGPGIFQDRKGKRDIVPFVPLI